MSEPTTDTKTARLEVRLTPAELDAIRNAHAATYPKHRLSFSAWAVATLLRAAKRAST